MGILMRKKDFFISTGHSFSKTYKKFKDLKIPMILKYTKKVY